MNTVPCSPFPVPRSLFPVPRSLFPVPRSLIPSSPVPRSLFPVPSHKGFTLIELLVVIGIIGILVGVGLTSFSGGTESARAAKCLANMRNMAIAWDSGCAGSVEMLNIKTENGETKGNYSESKGWISSNTQGLYPSDSHQTFSPITMAETDRDLVKFAFTNGWMSARLGHVTSGFVCPSHASYKKNETPNWSYLMSAYFGWDAAQGGHTYISAAPPWRIKRYLTNADRLLIFAEIPFRGPTTWNPDPSNALDGDAVLQYKGCAKAAGITNARDGQEQIGFNHKNGKSWYAHVAFADGHTERFVAPKSEANMLELTTWLCEGKAVSLQSGNYELLDQ